MNSRFGFQVWFVGYDHVDWFFWIFQGNLIKLAGVNSVNVYPLVVGGARTLVTCLFNSEDDRIRLLGTEHMPPDTLVAGLFAEAKSKGLIPSSLQLINPGRDLQLVRKLSQ